MHDVSWVCLVTDMGRYANTQRLNFGNQYGTSYTISKIREGIKNGSIRFEQISLQEGQRIDTLAGQYYGDSNLGWIIAAASDVGFILQAPAGTLIRIPNISDVNGVVPVN